ncbi:restriction endonuclease subunit S, partial [[Mycoplasma] falconis]
YAISGKLTKQLPSDSSVEDLLALIKKEKEKLIAEKKIKANKTFSYIYKKDNKWYEEVGDKVVDITGQIPFDIPESWQWVNLEYVSMINNGVCYLPSDLKKEGIPVLRSNNIKNDKIDLSNLIFLEESNVKDKIITKNDILMTASNGSRNLVGKVAKIKDSRKYSFGSFMYKITSKINDYLFYFFISNVFKSQLTDISTTTINRISKSMLLKIKLPLPPVEEQQRITGKLEQIFELLKI